MKLVYIQREISNFVIPIYCCICRRYVPERHPFCCVCLSHMKVIPPLDMRVTRRKCMSLAAATVYEGSIVSRILGKHRQDVAAFDEVGWLVAHRCASFIACHDVLVPISLHWRRLLQRGFHQADIMCKRIAQECHIPYVSCLSRTRWSESQANKTRTQRQRNVAHSFSVKHVSYIQGQRICLVDDVSSTGATMAEAARILLYHGASCVSGVVVARVV